jgi:hypothetical protein
MKNLSKGSITLIALLAGIVVIGILFVRAYSAPTPSSEMAEVRGDITSGTAPTTTIGAARADIDAARAAKEKLDAHNDDISAVLGE